LDEAELRYVKKGVEWGLECWHEVLGYAMDGLEEEPKVFKGTLLANNPHGLN
jgi:alpha-amylase/alpha-mannosidase (GH57 family)